MYDFAIALFTLQDWSFMDSKVKCSPCSLSKVFETFAKQHFGTYKRCNDNILDFISEQICSIL